MNWINKVISFLKLVRWPNLLMIIVIQLSLYFVIIGKMYSLAGINGFLLTKGALGLLDLALLIAATTLIAAGGYIINDYFDLRTDRINKPNLMILGKTLTLKTGTIAQFVLNGIAILIGFYLAYRVGSWRLGLIFPMIIMLLWLYSVKYKRIVIWGNVAIAFMAAMVIIILWLFEFFMLRQQPENFVAITPYLGTITKYFVMFSAFAFLLTFIREVVKDAEDVEGDKIGGIDTLAVVYGINVSKKVALAVSGTTALLLLYIVINFISLGMVIAGVYYAFAVLIPLIYLMLRISKADGKNDFHLLSNIIKIIMIAGIIGLQPIAMTIG